MRGVFRARVLRCAVPAGVATTATVVVSSVVFACTASMGAMTITPTSGPAGTKISTTATGMKANATYALHYAKTSSGNCMSFSGVVTLRTISSGSAGGWTNVTATIPTKTSMGVHSLCGMEVSPTKGATGTVHDSFTVT